MLCLVPPFSLALTLTKILGLFFLRLATRFVGFARPLAVGLFALSERFLTSLFGFSKLLVAILRRLADSFLTVFVAFANRLRAIFLPFSTRLFEVFLALSLQIVGSRLGPRRPALRIRLAEIVGPGIRGHAE